MAEFVAPKYRALGERILVVELSEEDRLAAQRSVWAYAAAARSLDGVLECVPAMNGLTVMVDPLRTSLPALRDHLSAAPRAAAARERRVEIEVRYDGEDLDLVASAAGMSADDVVALHSGREYVAYFLGFQPGFAYLGDVDERLRVARRASPRARVEAKSVAIADSLTAVYPFASPGGWNLIGRTDAVLFDPVSSEPSAILPGDRVRFIPR
jgi:KipI family sensor histidine kinase inhibitor